jgi:hypothetical protein
MTISAGSRVYKIFADELHANPKKAYRTVSRKGNGVGSVVSMQEGSALKAIRLTQLQACTRKLKKKFRNF